jgi:hypothetical protein
VEYGTWVFPRSRAGPTGPDQCRCPHPGQPNAISMSADTVDVFAWGEDNALLRRRYNSTAGLWEPADGFFTVTDMKLSGPPSAMSDKTGNISVFAYSDDGKLRLVTLPRVT